MDRVAHSIKMGPGEMARELRVHTALAKDQNLGPRTLRLSPGDLTPSSGLHGHQHSCAHLPSAVRVVVSFKNPVTVHEYGFKSQVWDMGPLQVVHSSWL